MDDDIDLARRLCTRAGMIMEDVSVGAILNSGDSATLRATVGQLTRAAAQISALSQAAATLIAID